MWLEKNATLLSRVAAVMLEPQGRKEASSVRTTDGVPASPHSTGKLPALWG